MTSGAPRLFIATCWACHLFAAGQLAFFDCGGVRLMLDKPEKAEFDHPSSILYFAVPDIRAAYRKLVDAGLAIEGNVMALMSEVPRSA
jgi:hypothetical protein